MAVAEEVAVVATITIEDVVAVALAFAVAEAIATEEAVVVPGVPKKVSSQIRNKKIFSQRVNVRE